MLTSEVIEAENIGYLVRAAPIAPWSPQPRVFFMCQPLHKAILAGRQSPEEAVRTRWARLEAAMDNFIIGGLVTDDLIKQLVPEKFEHWELRSRKPRPSLRVFGRFACPDVFIGTHVVQRNMLGGMWSSEFEHHKLVCEQHWKESGLSDPFSDAPMHRYDVYITTNARKKKEILPI